MKTLTRPMHLHEQEQAVSYLQEVIIESKRARGSSVPDMLEMQIYHLLSSLNALPEFYKADWPTELTR